MSSYRAGSLVQWVAVFAAAAMLSPAATSAAPANDFPVRPVRLIVPAPPGGAGDISARAIAEHMAGTLKQAVIVENRPGAATLLGLRGLIREAPDGYTIGLLPVTGVAIATVLHTDVPDLERDFSYVAGVVNAPHALVVPASLGVTSARELAALLESAPGKYNYASQGTGSLSHMESALFLDGVGAQAEHIPYKGSSEAMPGLLSGETSFMFDSLASVRPHVESGALVALGTAASARVPQFPDVPTMTELGIEKLAADNPFAFVAPRDTPPATIAVLTEAVRAALEDPRTVDTLTRAGMVPAFRAPAEIAREAGDNLAFWPPLARQVATDED